jgi:hypothetical protein
VKNASRLKNSTLLVEVNNKKRAGILLKANLLSFYPIQVERHTSLNSSWGIVSADSLHGMSDKKIQSAVANQSVSKAHRLIGKRDGKPFSL